MLSAEIKILILILLDFHVLNVEIFYLITISYRYINQAIIVLALRYISFF